MENTSNPLWRLFSSVKLTIVLLIVLALASILGTVIPQQGQKAVEFARELSPALFRFFNALGLFDIYHSLWFRLLIGALALNLIICSIDRFSNTWRRFTARPRPDRERPFERLPEEQRFEVRDDFESSILKVGNGLKSRFKRVDEKRTEGRAYFFSQKGRYSYFGVYLIHLSVLIILVGALWGSFFGFEAFVNIAEGETVDAVHLRKNRATLDLGFRVRCDKFLVEFYENGAPKEYRSDLSFLVGDAPPHKASVLVNHPTTFEGVTFYQSSYGNIPGNMARLRISRHTSEDETTVLEAAKGEFMELPGNEGRFRIEELSGNLKGVMGPAVLIEVQPLEGERVRFWVFQNPEILRSRFPPQMLQATILNASAFEPYTFFLENLESVYYTGLQVNRDPGVPLVWTGCFLMVAGFVFTFFTSHKRFWVRLTSTKKGRGTNISVAGTANKNPVGLQRDLDSLTKHLSTLFEEKG